MAGALATFFWLFSSLLCFRSHARGRTSPSRSMSISNATATDELALLSFKSVLDSHGSALDSWNTSIHFCSWPGVSCGRRHPERVVALSMRASDLSGRISPSLGNLSFLRELDLRKNRLVGEIPPELGRLGRLQSLNLSTNSLEGGIPPAMEGCTNLEVLVLSKNQLRGEIPEGLGNMENLYMLDLQENRLSGEIPESLPNLSSSIMFLFLYNNMLTGAIPPALGNLSGLLHLDLMENMLSGAILWSLGMLSSLSLLSLAYNSLNGEIPASIWNISSLWGIYIQENNLTGTIPARAFSKLSELRTLSMDNNGFHGNPLASLANASQLRLVQLGFNSFSGVIPPQIGNLRNMEWMLLSNTLLGAEEPGDWEFMRALENCSQLLILDLTNCKFSGNLPRSVSNLSVSLQTLYLPYNKISGTLPEDIGNLVSLQSLVVDSNSFTGTLPSSIGNLKNLRLLSASDSNFTGSIPLSVGNLTELNTLNIKANAFSDIIPSTLGNLTKLLELRLGRNYFTGPIPAALFSIPTLSIALDLSHNSFGGPIPEEIGNLINLVEFHAESNNFTGSIPDRLGECQLLRYLYLQNNFLSGNVPSLLGQLKGLQFLDLSSNNFSGHIPGFFGNFSMLNYINLSFNSFVGEVPTFGAFANVSAISLQGNNKLCGGISDLHLPPCTSLPPAKRNHKLVVIPIVTSLVVIIFMLPLLCILLIWYKKRKPKIPSTTSMQGHRLISYSQLVRATNDFSETNFLGSGSFGSVYKGELNDEEGESTNLVAVKVLRLQNPMALKSFIAECEALRNMRHRNLLKIFTVCSSIDRKGNHFKAIVYDFMPNGCLEEWLHPNTNLQEEQRYLKLLERVVILLDVAYALDYLHCHGPEPVVHCDLKSSNVLLDADMVAHVGDFGLAKILVERSSSAEQPTSSMGFRGTIGYAAPEYGAGNIASTHGDIYSYGILVLETVTGKRPTDSGFGQGLSLRECVEGALHNTVMDAVDIRLSMDLEARLHTMGDCSYKSMSDCIVLLLRLGVSCTQETPWIRMPIGSIIKELHGIKDSLLTGNRE